ncbi:MAG: LamG-like jellyroll fold domain-containing protein, partial [Aeoliella sp.]
MTEFNQNEITPLDPARLISAYLDGQISEPEFFELSEWLSASADHARQFARAAMVHSSLRSLLQHADLHAFLAEEDSNSDLNLLIDPKNIRRMLDEADEAERIRAKETAREQARRDAEAERQSRRMQEIADRKANRRPEPIEIPRSVAYLAVAAAVALVVFGVQSLIGENDNAIVQPVAQIEPPDVTAPSNLVATVVDSQSARWLNAGVSTVADTRLAAGPLTLETGVVEIAFNSGAHVIAEAPIELELVSPDRLIVSRGKLVAKVPEEAIGFTIVADAAAIVDLGTEFGVEVSNEGEVGVHVLDGEVALVPDVANDDAGEETAPRETLTVGTARKVSADGKSVDEIEFDRAAFLHEVPTSPYELAVLQGRPVAFWRMNELAGTPQVASLGRLNSAGAVGRGVMLGQSSDRPEPDNRAADFAGAHDGIDLGYVADLALTDNFTLEAWVRTPRSVEVPSPQRIVSTFCESPRAGFAFGITGRQWIGGGREDLPSLMLHFTFYGVYDCISVVRLEPDRWTHVAAVIDSKGRPTLFIDGQPVDAELRWDAAKGGGAFQPLPDPWNPGFRGASHTNACYLGRNPPAADAQYPPEAWQG